jgi:hypothetical protein
MKNVMAVFLLIAALFTGCKKEEEEVRNVIEYDIDGLHQAFHSTGVLQVDTIRGATRKALTINSYMPALDIIILEDVSPDSSDYLATGRYPNLFHSPGCGDATPHNCRSFGIAYADNGGKTFMMTSGNDSASYFDVISCSGNPPEITANFRAELADADGNGTIKHINGKLEQVLYFRE